MNTIIFIENGRELGRDTITDPLRDNAVSTLTGNGVPTSESKAIMIRLVTGSDMDEVKASIKRYGLMRIWNYATKTGNLPNSWRGIFWVWLNGGEKSVKYMSFKVSKDSQPLEKGDFVYMNDDGEVTNG